MTDDSQNVLKCIMPHSEEGEHSILGAVFVGQNSLTIALEHCSTADFYSKQYGIIFSCMVEFFNEDKLVDILMVQEKLKAKDVPSEMQGLDFLHEITQSEATATNIRECARTVRAKTVKRKLIQASGEIANSCYADNQELETLLQETKKKMLRVLQQRNAAEFTPISKIILRVLERIQEAYQNGAEATGISTGFMDLDRKLNGLQLSDLVLIVARSSMGKTVFVLNIVEHATVRNDRSCMIFSFEASKEQLTSRILLMESSVDAQKIRSDDLPSGDFSNIIEAAVHISKSKNLAIGDTTDIGIGELRSEYRKQKSKHGVDLVTTSYLQLMGSSGRSGEDRQQEISDTSRSLEALARELQAPVIIPSQLSHAVKQRPDHRPMLSDLREFGAIEQDANIVMFLYRDGYYNKDTEYPNGAEVIIAEQRNDPIGTVSLVWKPDTMCFTNVAH